MLWKDIVTKALLKAGFSQTEITTGISNMETDVEDSVANSRLSAIYTADEAKGSDAIFGDIKNKTRAEALNPIDAEIKALEEDLTPEQKTAYSALGNNTFEKVKFLTKATKENIASAKKTGDPNYDELKANFDRVQASLGTDFVKKEDYDNALNALSSLERERVYGKAILAARKTIKSDKKDHKHFEGNFTKDIEDVLNDGIITISGGKDKVKGTVDYKTGKIMRQDNPDQPMMINGAVATIETIVPFAVEFGEYDKDYVPLTPGDDFTVRGKAGDSKEELSLAAQRNLEAIGGLPK